MSRREEDSVDEWDSEEDSQDVEVESPCPNCRFLIHLDAVRCPKCGHYITEEDNQGHISFASKWVTITAIILLLAFLIPIVGC